MTSYCRCQLSAALTTLSPLVCQQQQQFGDAGRLGEDGTAHAAPGQTQQEREGVLETLGGSGLRHHQRVHGPGEMVG